MPSDYVLEQMLKTLIDRRDKLAYAIVKLYDEGYNIDNRKANLFCLISIVSECSCIVHTLSANQRNKLLNIINKLLIL